MGGDNGDAENVFVFISNIPNISLSPSPALVIRLLKSEP